MTARSEKPTFLVQTPRNDAFEDVEFLETRARAVFLKLTCFGVLPTLRLDRQPDAICRHCPW